MGTCLCKRVRGCGFAPRHQCLLAHVRVAAAARGRGRRQAFPPHVDGAQSRCVINAAGALVEAAPRLRSSFSLLLYLNGGFAGGETRFLSLPSTPLDGAAQRAGRALGAEPQLEYVPTPVEIRDKYQYFTQADMSRLREAGYTEGFTSLEDGIRDYVQNYLHTDDPYV